MSQARVSQIRHLNRKVAKLYMQCQGMRGIASHQEDSFLKIPVLKGHQESMEHRQERHNITKQIESERQTALFNSRICHLVEAFPL